jgi:hypothetical protein
LDEKAKIKAKKQHVATSRWDLAALCNAGGPVGLRRLRDRARLAKVSMGKGRAFDRVRGELVVLAGAAKADSVNA